MSRRRRDLSWLTARPIAHRGLHDLAAGRPENTIAAFRATIEADYAIECDLHPAADGVPVVFHDDDLKRLTGAAGSVRDCRADELRRRTVCGTGETIPTLDDLLDFTADRVALVLELKSVRGRDGGFAAAVADRLSRYRGPVAVMSFEPRLMAEMRRHAPKVARGLTAEGDWRHGAWQMAAVLGLDLHFVSYSLADLPTWAPLLARRRFGRPLISWTIRSRPEAAEAMRWTDQITFEGFPA